MSDEDHKVCDVCHKRLATHHICYGHTGETRDLCMECFEQTAAPAELESYRESTRRLRDAKCKYCGAPAIGGSTSCGIPGVMDEQSEFWCKVCQLDLAEFARLPENAIPDDFDVEDEARLEQISQQLAERTRRQEEFMRQKVRARLR